MFSVRELSDHLDICMWERLKAMEEECAASVSKWCPQECWEKSKLACLSPRVQVEATGWSR